MDFLKHEGFSIFNNNNKAITIIEMKCTFVQQEGTENLIIKNMLPSSAASGAFLWGNHFFCKDNKQTERWRKTWKYAGRGIQEVSASWLKLCVTSIQSVIHCAQQKLTWRCAKAYFRDCLFQNWRQMLLKNVLLWPKYNVMKVTFSNQKLRWIY